jgi:hypothetical protein
MPVKYNFGGFMETRRHTRRRGKSQCPHVRAYEDGGEQRQTSVVHSSGMAGVMGTQLVGEERRQDRGGLYIRTYKAGGEQRQTKRCSISLRDRRVRPHTGVPQRLGLGNLRRSVSQFSLGTDDSRVHTEVERLGLSNLNAVLYSFWAWTM